jgi:hypothetical protein
MLMVVIDPIERSRVVERCKNKKNKKKQTDIV